MKYVIILFALLIFSSYAMGAMVYNADEAFCDAFGRVCGDGHAFKINNKQIRGNSGSNSFSFVDDFAFLTVNDDDNAVLMARISNGIKTYDIYAEFNGL